MGSMVHAVITGRETVDLAFSDSIPTKKFLKIWLSDRMDLDEVEVNASREYG